MNKFILPSLAALLMLGACATATPYQPAEAGTTASGGYAEQQVEGNRFIVSFSGNSLTDRRRVETYLLFRSAELTSQNGFDWFEVVRRDTEAETSYLPTSLGSPYYSGFYCNYAYYGPRGRMWPGARGVRDPFYDPFWGEPAFREITRYEASAEIILGRGSKPQGAQYFDAEDVMLNLLATIERPQAR